MLCFHEDFVCMKTDLIEHSLPTHECYYLRVCCNDVTFHWRVEQRIAMEVINQQQNFWCNVSLFVQIQSRSNNNVVISLLLVILNTDALIHEVVFGWKWFFYNCKHVFIVNYELKFMQQPYILFFFFFHNIYIYIYMIKEYIKYVLLFLK